MSYERFVKVVNFEDHILKFEDGSKIEILAICCLSDVHRVVGVTVDFGNLGDLIDLRDLYRPKLNGYFGAATKLRSCGGPWTNPKLVVTRPPLPENGTAAVRWEVLLERQEVPSPRCTTTLPSDTPTPTPTTQRSPSQLMPEIFPASVVGTEVVAAADPLYLDVNEWPLHPPPRRPTLIPNRAYQQYMQGMEADTVRNSLSRLAQELGHTDDVVDAALYCWRALYAQRAREEEEQ